MENPREGKCIPEKLRLKEGSENRGTPTGNKGNRSTDRHMENNWRRVGKLSKLDASPDLKKYAGRQKHPGTGGNAVEMISLDEIEARKEKIRQGIERFTGINAVNEFQKLFEEVLNLVLEKDGLGDAMSNDSLL
ncbi:hypothetical protein JTB14_018890 [Gonioctena quinquepunctata]|nr:hypothetical protein JTB14_018890 [Gonioctena quinquepunctata]